MTKAALVALASVVIAAGPAFADGAQGHGGQRLHSSLPARVFPHQRFFNGRDARFGFVGGAPVVAYGYGIDYGASDYVVSPPTYYPPFYSPSLSYTPMRTVIEFPSGRWVLQGDGITAPYRWAWLPNPPSDEPPTPPPPPAPAASAPVPHLDYYRWTDADGVVHLTDSIDRVPQQYRAKATKSKT